MQGCKHSEEKGVFTDQFPPKVCLRVMSLSLATSVKRSRSGPPGCRAHDSILHTCSRTCSPHSLLGMGSLSPLLREQAVLCICGCFCWNWNTCSCRHSPVTTSVSCLMWPACLASPVGLPPPPHHTLGPSQPWVLHEASPNCAQCSPPASHSDHVSLL